MAGLYDMLKEGKEDFSIAKDSKISKEKEPPKEEEPLKEEAEEPPKEEAIETWGGLAGCAAVLIAGIAIFLSKKLYLYWFDFRARWGVIFYSIVLASLFIYIIVFLVGKRNAKIK